MRNEEIAYQNGFRVSVKGELSNIYNRPFTVNFKRKVARFTIMKNGNPSPVSVGRLQAFQKFGIELYNFKRIRFIDSDSSNNHYDNIQIGNGCELIPSEFYKYPKTKRAFLFGYSVDRAGNLLFNGKKSIKSVGLDRYGYSRFYFAYKTKKQQLIYIHRLQAFQKFGDKLFESDCVRHKNNIPSDNSWDNILIGSFKENQNDIPLEIKAQRYLKIAHKNIKYPVPVRNKIRKLYMKNKDIAEISKRVNVPLETVRYIANGNSIV